MASTASHRGAAPAGPYAASQLSEWEIDRAMPRCDFVQVRERVIRAPIDVVFSAIVGVNFRRVSLLADMLAWLRIAPSKFRSYLRGDEAPELQERITIRDAAASDEWRVLLDDPPREFLIGAVGKFWRPVIEWAPVRADDFCDFDEPGWAKVVVGFRLERLTGNRTLVTYEARTRATDERSRTRFAHYWAFIRPFAGYLMGRLLSRVDQHARVMSSAWNGRCEMVRLVKRAPESAVHTMQLNGIHHITAVTADAPGNVDFYARVLGLRLVKKSVNQDDPTVYHLFYGDEAGHPGNDLTFFEYPGVPRGRAGDGMVHRIVWRVLGEEALDFWRDRLTGEGVNVTRGTDERGAATIVFADPEGLAHELSAFDNGNEPLVAHAPDIPAGYELQGFAGVRVYASNPEESRPFMRDIMGFESEREGRWSCRGESREGFYSYEEPPSQPGLRGAGTVHHIAWYSSDDELTVWQRHLGDRGAKPTPVIDRHYFKSVYFTEPSGVLFELATPSPGFTVDEPLAHLGEAISLPPKFEPLRDRVEQTLTPLENPRVAAQRSGS